MPSSKALKQQLAELMAKPENMKCVDCGDKRPMWASLIVPPPEASFGNPIGCFCCYQCSGAHRRMGTHICFVRSTNLDEWKGKELEAMKDGGNTLINKIFEANMKRSERNDLRPTNQTDLDERSAFIYDKYQHRKWYNPKKAVLPKKSADVPTPSKASAPLNAMEEDFFQSRMDFGDWTQEVVADKTPAKLKDNCRPEERSRRALMGALQRKESKRQVLEDIIHLDIDHDNPQPSPRKVSRSRNLKKSSGPSRRTPNQSSGSTKIVRTKSDGSHSSYDRTLPTRAKSLGSYSDDRRRRVRRTESGDSKTLKRGNRRQPTQAKRRGSNDDEPMDQRRPAARRGSNSEIVRPPDNPRSKSAKRGVRRTKSDRPTQSLQSTIRSTPQPRDNGRDDESRTSRTSRRSSRGPSRTPSKDDCSSQYSRRSRDGSTDSEDGLSKSSAPKSRPRRTTRQSPAGGRENAVSTSSSRNRPKEVSTSNRGRSPALPPKSPGRLGGRKIIPSSIESERMELTTTTSS